MRLEEATQIARELLSYFGPCCVRAQIGGSIRRNKAEVKDIELVMQPRYASTPDLFGQPTANTYSELDDLLGRLIAAEYIAYDTQVKRNGKRYKRLVLPQYPETAIELFLAEEGNWGNILAIRTGNAEFSKALVTKRLHGGLMPTDLRQEGGFLWRGGDQLPCRTEAEFFNALGIATEDIPHPTQRNAEAAARMARKRVSA